MTSKMDPKIVKIQGSVKIVFLHPLSIENLVFEVPGPPKSDQKSFKNVIGNWIASKTCFFSLQCISKCKSVAQWSKLGPKWGDTFVAKSSKIGLWAKSLEHLVPQGPKVMPKGKCEVLWRILLRLWGPLRHHFRIRFWWNTKKNLLEINAWKVSTIYGKVSERNA